MNNPAIYTSNVKKKTILTTDVLELQIEKPVGFVYTAGQFVQWLIPGKTPLFRSYSLSCAPSDSVLEFCVKLLPQGKGSMYALTLLPGSPLTFQGPRGLFINQASPRPLYCVATGVGLAPIISIIRDELETKKTDAEVKLLFGVRSEDDLFWQERLAALKQKFINFDYTITLSQPKPNNGWGGLRGRVTDHVLHHLVNHHFFLCGNVTMIKDMRQMLLDNGVDAKQIHFEIF